MATCKDCVHYIFCKDGSPYIEQTEDKHCRHFKNKASVIEVPDEAIISIKDKWLVINTENKDLGRAIKYCMDYLTKDARGADNGKVY